MNILAAAAVKHLGISVYPFFLKGGGGGGPEYTTVEEVFEGLHGHYPSIT